MEGILVSHQSTFPCKPLVSSKDLSGEHGSLQTHEDSVYHKKAVEKGENFIKSYLNPERSVGNQLDNKRLAEIVDNTNRPKPIIATVIFLGRQNIPFRGHRDYSDVLAEKTPSPQCDEPASSDVANEGNFRELVRFRVRSGDSILEAHLKNSSSRATYISKSKQNEFIRLCVDEIRETIIQRVGKAATFSLLFDETTDASGKLQISLSVRYVFNDVIREDFICFFDAFDELAKEREGGKVPTQEKDCEYITGDSSKEGNSEEEGLEAVDAEKKDSEKKSNVSDSKDIISDKEEFESIRMEI